MNLYEKLAKIQGISVTKDATNPFFHSKYATLDNIIEVLAPMLVENKLLVFHKTQNGELITVLQDTESEDKIESSIKLPDLQDPQKLGSAITYFKRYNLCQIFNIVSDEDDDGNVASNNNRITGQQATQYAKTFENKPEIKKWFSDVDFESNKHKFKKGDNPKDIINKLFNSGIGVSKDNQKLITDYINQL